MKYLPYLFFGAVFGFILSRAGATHFEVINGMFLFSDFQLYFVIGGAFMFNLVAFQALSRAQVMGRGGAALNLPTRVYHQGTVPGAVIFGIGWALTGTCPGTAMVQLGEGHLVSLATLGGIFTGAWLYPMAHARWFHWQATRCGD